MLGSRSAAPQLRKVFAMQRMHVLRRLEATPKPGFIGCLSFWKGFLCSEVNMLHRECVVSARRIFLQTGSIKAAAWIDANSRGAK